MLNDFRHALRRLRKAPGFTIVAVLTLMLGIGANTAIFSLLQALILGDLAVRDPEALVQLSLVMRNGQETGLSFPAFQQIERGSRDVFASVMATTGESVLTIDVNGQPGRGTVSMVTGNFHSELGARPTLGRLLTTEEVDLDTLNPTAVAVLGYQLWQRRFGGDPTVVGRTISIEGEPFTIVGVTLRGFRGLTRTVEPDVTVPLTAQRLISSPGLEQWRLGNVLWVNVIGRLKPGVSVEQARAKLTAVWPNVLAATMPAEFSGVRRDNFLAIRLVIDTVVAPSERLLRRQITRPLVIVMGVAGFVLLIACVNLAALMLARVMERRREIGVHLALGAAKWRLASHVLAEGLVLSIVGSACAVAVAPSVSRAVGTMLMGNYLVPRSLNTNPDARVVALTAAIAIGTGLLFSGIPAWRASRRDCLVLLQNGGRVHSRSGRLGARLVVSQIALCLMLLITAGLLVRTLSHLRSLSPGFLTNGVLAAVLQPRMGAARATEYDNTNLPTLVDALRSLAGVQEVSTAFFMPGSGYTGREFVSAASSDPGEEVRAAFNGVSPGFFQLLGIPLLQGRDFTWTDGPRAQPVAIISHALARRLFGDQPPVGQHIRIGFFPHRQQLQVIGVVSDARLYDVRDENVHAAYVSQVQDPVGYGMALLLRGAAISAREVTEVVRSLGHQYVATIDPLDIVRDSAILPQHATALMGGFFGALALLLAGIGVFGLASYDLSERTREIGIRLALGATPGRVIAGVLIRGAGVAFTGVAIGLAASWLTVRLVRSLLFGVSEHDPITLAGTTLLLLAVTIVAGVVPAMRASRIDAITALKSE